MVLYDGCRKIEFNNFIFIASTMRLKFKPRKILLCFLIFILTKVIVGLLGLEFSSVVHSHVIQTKVDSKSVLVKRTKEYCNSPDADISGLEAQRPDVGYVLLSSAIMFRHGDRLSISRPPSFHESLTTPQQCEFHSNQTFDVLIAKYLKAINSFKSVIGSKVNKVLAEKSFFPDTCSELSVTRTGIVQMLKLGKYLGERYLIDKTNSNSAVLDSIIQPIQASTTKYTRTFQSLLAFLYGFSPTGFKDILSHSIGVSSTIYFCDSDVQKDPAFGGNCDCPKAKRIRELRAAFRKWEIQEPNIIKIFSLLGICNEIVKGNYTIVQDPHNEFNIDQNELLFTHCKTMDWKNKKTVLAETSPSRVLDWLFSEYFCPGVPPPCVQGYPQQCLTNDMIKDLMHLVDNNHMDMVKDYHYTEATSLAIFPFLKSLSKKFNSDFKNSFNKEKPLHPSLWLLSSHDITIGPLCIALGIPLTRKVPYASRFIFELWKPPKDHSEPLLRVLLNGENITHLLPFCKNLNNKEWTTKGLCSLSAFDNFLSGLFLQRFTTTNDYDQACELR